MQSPATQPPTYIEEAARRLSLRFSISLEALTVAAKHPPRDSKIPNQLIVRKFIAVKNPMLYPCCCCCCLSARTNSFN